MAWKGHVHEGKTYTFHHLEPRTEVFIRPATSDKPEEKFTVDVRYTDHCFTLTPLRGETFASSQVYSVSYARGEKKVRLFCPGAQ